MTRLNKLSALAAAVALSGGLAACGGGSSSTTMMPEPMPTPQEMCEDDGGRYEADMSCTSAEMLAAETEATDISDAIDDARMAVAGLTGASTDMDVEEAKTAITDAHNAITGAQHASASDTADSLAELDMIRTSLTTAEGTIATYRSDEMAKETARIAAITKEAGTKLTQIEAEAASDGTDGLGGTGVTIGTGDGNYSLEIEYGSTTVTVHAADEDDNVEFESMDLGGGLFMNTRDIEATEGADAMPAMEEVAMIMTDIEDDTATAFGMVHTLDVRVDGETVVEGTSPADALDVVTANLGHVKAAAFTAPAGTVGTTDLSFQHEVADDDGTPEDESMAAAEIMGTYEGAMGTYKCNATSACTVTVNGEGVVSAVTADDWIFIPADGATVDVADTEYLHYGFWLKRSTDADGVVTYNQVQTFAGASEDLSASGSTAAVVGTASYSGDAVGVYVHHVLSEGGGTVASSTAGHFTADVSLSAAFGGGDVALNDQQRLTGTINNFMLSGGEANDWSVALESDGAADDGIQPDPDGELAGTAMGGSGDGSFSAIYHGTADAENQPSAVVGEFNAGFRNGVAAGAFGATIDDE